MSEPVKAPPGHIIDDQGNVRKVLGTLPVTADGCVVGHGVKLYWCEEPYEISHYETDFDGVWFEDHATDYYGEAVGKDEPISKCYSTKEAAEAAAEAARAT